MGLMRNVQYVMGDNPLLWLVPTGKELDSIIKPAIAVECQASECMEGQQAMAPLHEGDFLVWRSTADVSCSQNGRNKVCDERAEAHSVTTSLAAKLASCIGRQ
mmetsp:Transcript_137443/g.256616  ORF Transcript_137443/g.256616 Transcript_137443/m.256616 type:complete len:103 (-) Transcript_137443:59-367(-)